MLNLLHLLVNIEGKALVLSTLRTSCMKNMKKKKQKKYHKRGLPPGTLVYTGSYAPKAIGVRHTFFNEDDIQVFDSFKHKSAIPEPYFEWVDIKGLSFVQEVEEIGNHYAIHPLALEDALNTQQRPKMEEYDNGIFYVMHLPICKQDLSDIEIEQISFYWNERILVSFQDNPDDTFHAISERLTDPRRRIRKKGIDYLAYILIDYAIDSYYEVLEKLENEAQEITSLLADEYQLDDMRNRIFHLRTQVSEYKRYILPLRDATTKLYRMETEFIQDNNRVYFRDIADHVTQFLDAIENIQDSLNNYHEMYLSEVSNRMNNVMKLLTIISTIFIPLSFIASVYGMNFKYMPELEWRFGYFLVLSVMLTLFLGMVGYFKRKNWM